MIFLVRCGEVQSLPDEALGRKGEAVKFLVIHVSVGIVLDMQVVCGETTVFLVTSFTIADFCRQALSCQRHV